jgi:hypothetical protein
MKKFILFLSLLAVSFLVLPAQNVSDLDAFEKAIKPGTVLTYDVEMSGKKYQFIATLKKVGDEIVFDWNTSAPENKKGSITISAGANAKADALFNLFKEGATNLDKEISVFISRKMFNDVSTTSATNIKINGASDTATVMSNTISEFNFNLNGNLVAIPGWELQGGSDIKYTIDVIESTKFPIIYRIDLGWTMQLSEVKNP